MVEAESSTDCRPVARVRVFCSHDGFCGLHCGVQISHAYYLIIDLEATCSDDGAVPRHEMEIIEIGAVLQSARTFEVQTEFQTFVQPVRHPTLTKFCNELTGITQSDVENAPLFRPALEAMKAWLWAFNDTLFCSWGDYDRRQFHQDCAYHQVAYPFHAEHLNLKAAFSQAVGRGKKLGIAEALRHLGMEFEGSPHRGLDDARNVARIVQRVGIDG